MRVVGIVFLTFFGLMLLTAPLYWMAASSYQGRVVPATEVWMEDGVWKTSQPETTFMDQPMSGINPTLGAVFFLLLCWGVLAYLSVRAVAQSRSGQQSGFNREETRTIQEVHRGLTTLEQRIESLETILMERYKKCPVPFD